MANSTSLPGPPYSPTHQGLGETPSVLPDIPISAVFLVLFAIGGAGHMTLFFKNKSKKHKFVFNALIFGFCMSRVTATSIRMAWACHQRNVNLGIAAEVFVNVGVIILYIVNLFFSLRIVRAQHPRIGWSRPLTLAIYSSIAVMVLAVPCLIASVIVQFYTQGASPQRSAHDIQSYGTTVYAVGSALPLPILTISTLLLHYHSSKSSPEVHEPIHFGTGSLRPKIFLVLLPSLFLSFAASLRAATTYLTPTPLMGPTPWYLSRTIFYFFSFTIEVLVVYTWLFARIDQRFYVPDGQNREGTKQQQQQQQQQRPEKRISQASILNYSRNGSWVGEWEKWEAERGEEEVVGGEEDEEVWGAMSPVVGGTRGCGRKSGCVLCSDEYGGGRSYWH